MKALAVPVTVVCLGLAACGGDGGSTPGEAAAAKPAANAPLKVALETRHHSLVNGTATLVQRGDNLTVTLKLSKHIGDSLLAHIHTGPCSDEPTAQNPRIWAGLTEVVDGHSKTTTNVVTLEELQAEPASINVHDPEHNQRPLVCGDIPRAG